jgi:uncharacterized protein (TIGR02266 family)
MDKREAVRVPVRVRAQCKTPGLVIDGLVEDVSRSGLFLAAVRHLKPGASVELDLELPGEASLVHLSAEVVRVENDERRGMGLRFMDDPLLARRPLANFIMRQHQAR